MYKKNVIAVSILLGLGGTIVGSSHLCDFKSQPRSLEKFKEIRGSICFVVDDTTDSFVAQVANGKGFCLTGSSSNLFVNPLSANLCKPVTENPQACFRIVTARLTGDIKFACRACTKPTILTGLEIDPSVFLGETVLGSREVLVNSMNAFVKNVTVDGFTVEIVIQFYVERLTALYPAILAIFPTLCFNFAAQYN